MASDLTPFSVVAPGFYGLNLQDAPSGLPKEFCLEASNAVIDNYGRLAARKGWEPIHASDSNLLGKNVKVIHEFVKTDGTVELLCIGNNRIWKYDNYELTQIYYDQNAFTDNWKVVNFNDYCYFFQRGMDPLEYDGTTVSKISANGSYSGTVQQANEVLSAYGRLWTADTPSDKKTVKWSDALQGFAWTGGSAGTLNLESVLTNGTSPIVALATFNGLLVVFCEASICLFSGADEDPSTNLALYDVIDGIGCISRDTVIDVGTDIFFLSNTGVRSLGRLIQDKANPIYDVSQNVRDNLMADYIKAYNADPVGAIAGYNPIDGFYILSLPGIEKSYVFDLKKRLENNVCRVTTWDWAPRCFYSRRNRDFLVGVEGFIGKYNGYTDNGSGYLFLYRSSYWSHDKPEIIKILKQARVLVLGGHGYDVAVRWSMDFETIARGFVTSLSGTGDAAEYAESDAEYGISEYHSDANRLQTCKAYLGGTGRVYQMEMETIIKGIPFSVQEINVFAKMGRLHNL